MIETGEIFQCLGRLCMQPCYGEGRKKEDKMRGMKRNNFNFSGYPNKGMIFQVQRDFKIFETS